MVRGVFRNKVVLFSIVLLVLLVGGVVYMWYTGFFSYVYGGYSKEDLSSADPRYSKARRLADRDGPEAAFSVYKGAIKWSSSDEERAGALLDLAAALWPYDDVRGDRTDAAIKYALQAEGVYPSEKSAATLYLYYSKVGDEAGAAKYMNIYNDRLPNSEVAPR